MEVVVVVVEVEEKLELELLGLNVLFTGRISPGGTAGHGREQCLRVVRAFKQGMASMQSSTCCQCCSSDGFAVAISSQSDRKDALRREPPEKASAK